MLVTGDNEYGARVYKDDADDRDLDRVTRALHAELCRRGPTGLHSTGVPACVRARSVMRRAQAEGELLQPGRAEVNLSLLGEAHLIAQSYCDLLAAGAEADRRAKVAPAVTVRPTAISSRVAEQLEGILRSAGWPDAKDIRP
jgi:hypothetical protein